MNRVDETRARVAALQDWLRTSPYDGLFIPRSDFWQGEEVMPCDERLRWLFGFGGSAGLALVLRDRAALFVDGRYTLVAGQLLDGTGVELRHIVDAPWQQWVRGPLNLAVDAKLVTGAWVDAARKALPNGQITLLDSNPLDALWVDQPMPVFTPVEIYPDNLSGEASATKRQRLAAQLKDRGLDAALITDPTGIAWLLNIRARDLAHTPVALSVALLHADGQVAWFTTPERDTPDLRAHLGAGATVTTPAAWRDAFPALAGQTLLVDETSAAAWLEDKLQAAGVRIQRGACITALAKAQKNSAELAGMVAAHVRDGLALTRFLHWYDDAVAGGDSGLTESQIMRQLEGERARANEYRGASFDTICGVGAHGAIVHYRTAPETDSTATGDTLLLLDSGGHYIDGTTDVTRTLPLGTPSDAMRDAYTRVLQGHIALVNTRFPAGTSGHQLDAIARTPLWRAGLNYDHGTGHGVGHYLSVHEGPARISIVPNTIPLLPGMVLSNEPGYYRAGAFGIRLENLITVRQDTGGFLKFETLTLAPFDRRLIVSALLNAEERDWLDAYHARVLALLGHQLEPADRAWLEVACAPLSDTNLG